MIFPKNMAVLKSNIEAFFWFSYMKIAIKKNKVEIISPKEYKIPYHHGIRNIEVNSTVNKVKIWYFSLSTFFSKIEKVIKTTIKNKKFDVLDRKRFFVVSQDMKKPTPDKGPDVSSTLYGPPKKPASSLNVLK